MTTTHRPEYVLTVLTGPNAGAQLPLKSRRVTLGGAGDVDFYLDGYTGAALELSVSKDRFRLKCDAGGIRMASGEVVAGGAPFIGALPATFHLDETIQVNLSVSQPQTSGRSKKHMLLGAALAICAAVGAVFVQMDPDLRFVADANARGNSGLEMPADTKALGMSVPTETAAVAEIEKPMLSQAEAEAELARLVSEAGLSGVVINPDAGVIRVGGVLSNEQLTAWRTVRDGYDQAFGHVAPLLVNVTEANVEPPISVSSVWLGDTPEVITRSGDILRSGDLTESGWQISQITAEAVELKRGGQTIVIDF